MAVDPEGTSLESFLQNVGAFFTGIGDAIKNFFVEDVYGGVIKPAVDWIGNVAAPAVGDFFTKTIPDFFVNSFWNDWIVDKVWNTFCVDWVWNTFCVDWVWNTFCVDWIAGKVWPWLNGDQWYQSLIKNTITGLISAGIFAAIGAIAGPLGAGVGAIIGLFCGILVSTLWDVLWQNTK